MGVIARLPWWTKLITKLILTRFLIPYSVWRRLGLFRHGDMQTPLFALKTFQSFYQHAVDQVSFPKDFYALELGPGDSVLSGLIAHAYGAKQTWLVDAGEFSDTSFFACQETIKLLNAQGKSLPDIKSAETIDEILRLNGVKYLTKGTASLAEIPDSTIHFMWSHVVLEHISRAEFPVFLKELRRIISPNGIAVHSIDFRDHLNGGLNNLRFASFIWESRIFREGGFYTNRIRPREMLAMFVSAGFNVELVKEKCWEEIPIRHEQLSNEFKLLPEEDFMVAEIEVILRPE